MANEKVTIIVPFISMNRYVEECIQGCLELDYEDFRLVLLPDAAVRLPFELQDPRVTVIETGEATIAGKRNLGMRRFRDSDYFAFIDSDAYPHPAWLKKGIRAFALSNEIGAVGGPHLGPAHEPLKQRVVGNALKSYLVSGYVAFSRQISENRFCPNLHSCNLIVKGDVVSKAGGFNEKLETGEDRELCSRIRQRRKNIFFDNTVLVYHYNRPLFKQFFLQRLTYGFYIPQIIRAQGNKFDFFLLLPAVFSLFMTTGLIIGIFNPVVLGFWGAIFCLSLSVVFVEAVKCSDRKGDTFLTFIAILTANIGYAVGTLLGVAKVNLRIKNIYKNFAD